MPKHLGEVEYIYRLSAFYCCAVVGINITKSNAQNVENTRCTESQVNFSYLQFFGVNCLFNVANDIEWTIAKMSEEETELRDLVAQTLENNGVLSRIRVYKIVCILLRSILLQYNVTSWLVHYILMFTLIFQWFLRTSFTDESIYLIAMISETCILVTA
jgi:hypothetical protein